MRGDGATTRLTLERMTDDELDRMLTIIQDRRLSLVKQMQQLEEARHHALREKLTQKVSKQFEMLAKELVRVETAIEKVELRVFKIKALRLEMDW